jgi:transposase
MKTKRSKAKLRAGMESISVTSNEREQKLEILRPDAAGIDCGAEEHYVAVPVDRVSAGQPTVRCFSAFTEGLDAAVDWLKECRVTTVAMESTGVYWVPLHQKLEAAGIEVYLVNARHVRCVPGRKTDVKDSQWLRQLHRFGLLNASFRPKDIICQLRSLHRHRDNLVCSSASEIQHMQKALQQMNLHLHHAVSDITGLTGLRIIDAILSGQRDPQELVKLRDKRVLKSTPQQMQAALVGDYRAEHLFVLSQSLQAYRFYQARIEECDRQMEPLLEKLAQQVEAASAQLELYTLKAGGAQQQESFPKPCNEPTSAGSPPKNAKRKRKPIGNEPKIELAGLLERICGIDQWLVASGWWPAWRGSS